MPLFVPCPRDEFACRQLYSALQGGRTSSGQSAFPMSVMPHVIATARPPEYGRAVLALTHARRDGGRQGHSSRVVGEQLRAFLGSVVAEICAVAEPERKQREALNAFIAEEWEPASSLTSLLEDLIPELSDTQLQRALLDVPGNTLSVALKGASSRGFRPFFSNCTVRVRSNCCRKRITYRQRRSYGPTQARLLRSQCDRGQANHGDSHAGEGTGRVGADSAQNVLRPESSARTALVCPSIHLLNEELPPPR